jgi:hypothetical protein
MFCRRSTVLLFASICLGLATLTAAGQTGDKKVAKKQEKKEVWTDPKDSTLPEDFKFQGEYIGIKSKIGCQVIALGNGMFQAVVCEGGLPGAGWDGKSKSLLHGKLEGIALAFSPAEGKRKYLAQSPMEFSATSKFPPAGQQPYMGTIIGNQLVLKAGDVTHSLVKTERKSPTLGMKAPDGAIVLFDGTNKDEWNGGRLDKATGLLNTDGKDMTTKRKFNSGFYQVDHYEVQILDSFGLEGKNNECGGVYQRLDTKVNACLPPLQWQTYDVEFTNAITKGDRVPAKARITLKHNGIVVHDNAEIAGVTGGARSEPEGTPGILRLQGHGNPLQFRNIWVVEKN